MQDTHFGAVRIRAGGCGVPGGSRRQSSGLRLALREVTCKHLIGHSVAAQPAAAAVLMLRLMGGMSDICQHACARAHLTGVVCLVAWSVGHWGRCSCVVTVVLSRPQCAQSAAVAHSLLSLRQGGFQAGWLSSGRHARSRLLSVHTVCLARGHPSFWPEVLSLCACTQASRGQCLGQSSCRRGSQLGCWVLHSLRAHTACRWVVGGWAAACCRQCV